MNGQETNAKTTPRDVFTHLLAVIALYISAVSFGALIFQYVDILFPDPLAYFPRGSRDAVRWALASLVVVFPVYVLVSWTLAKDVSAHPEKRELKTRKWLYHFTLFAAAAIIIGDVVALTYTFLGGDLSVRFVLKILTVLFIAASVFGYYLWYIRREEMASHDPRMRIFILAVAGIVTASIVAGFFVAGSPFRERMRRFDERRIQDLQNIQWQVVHYWRSKERLPENLEALRDDISGYVVPNDPKNGATYGYSVTGSLQFELCSEFDTESGEKNTAEFLRYPEAAYPGSPAQFDQWTHGFGRHCFSRTIDTDLYPPLNKSRPLPK